jgi:hypothetical protein
MAVTNTHTHTHGHINAQGGLTERYSDTEM